MAAPALWNPDHVVVSVSTDFRSNSQQDTPIHFMACDYSGANWGSRGDHLRDVPWEDNFKACAHYFLRNLYFSPNGSPSKTMKDVFYFI